MTLKLKGIFKNTTKRLGQIVAVQAIFECEFHSQILCSACVCRCCFYLATPKLVSFKVYQTLLHLYALQCD